MNDRPDEGRPSPHSTASLPGEGGGAAHSTICVLGEGRHPAHSTICFPDEGRHPAHSTTCLPGEGGHPARSTICFPGEGRHPAHSTNCFPGEGRGSGCAALAIEGQPVSAPRCDRAPTFAGEAISLGGTKPLGRHGYWPTRRLSSGRPLSTLLALAALVTPLAAQAQAGPSILRDAETEQLFADMSAGIVKAAGLNPRDVKIVLINDPSINAFVAGGQVVYVHSGLIQAADNINEVQGVVAHEVGHIADGHVISGEAAMKPAMKTTILSMVLGLAAVAAGAGAAGMGIMGLGQSVAMGNYLSFNRVQESTADASGIRYLSTAGVSGRGMLTFFKKLQQQEYRYRGEIDPFMQTHPLSGERIANLTADVQAAKAYTTKTDPALERRFELVKAKLAGYVLPYDATLKLYPPSNPSLPAHYARAYAYHKGGYPDRADAEAAALVTAEPANPYFQEIAGQILLEAGKPQAALAPLRRATEGSGSNPLIATTLGHALIATEDKANLPEAVRVLRVATQRDDDNIWAWMQLGTAYEQVGDEPRAALATAERAQLMGDQRTAAQSARYAMANIPANTPDWIRAQDISMTSADAMAGGKKKKKK